MNPLNKIALSQTDYKLLGVCGGLAAGTDSPAWAWRAGFVIFSIFGGSGVIIYLILWAFMPKTPGG